MWRALSLLFVLVTLSVNLFAQTAAVTFENATGRHVFLLAKTGQGDCVNKPGHTVTAIPSEGSTRIDSEGETVCYLYSFYQDPLIVPLNGGIAQPGEHIRLRAIVGKSDEWAEEKSDEEANSQIFLQPPATSSKSRLSGGEIRVGPATTSAAAVVEFVLADFLDPLNRQSRTECVDWASGHWPWCEWWKTCKGWKTEWRCIRHQFVLVATGPDEAAIRTAVEDCLKTAAVAGALSAVVAAFLGGSPWDAAAAVFVETLQLCLQSHSGAVGSIRVEHRTNWTNWGGC